LEIIGKKKASRCDKPLLWGDSKKRRLAKQKETGGDEKKGGPVGAGEKKKARGEWPNQAKNDLKGKEGEKKKKKKEKKAGRNKDFARIAEAAGRERRKRGFREKKSNGGKEDDWGKGVDLGKGTEKGY